jgi:hypothetical protein
MDTKEVARVFSKEVLTFRLFKVSPTLPSLPIPCTVNPDKRVLAIDTSNRFGIPRGLEEYKRRNR